MENMIRETLKGLDIALDERVKKVEELGTKDDSVLVEEKKQELQKELEEKLSAFVEKIEQEKQSAIDKLNRDIETIKELKEEYEGKLLELEETKVEETVDETVDGTEEVSGESKDEGEIPVSNNEVVNPFRP